MLWLAVEMSEQGFFPDNRTGTDTRLEQETGRKWNDHKITEHIPSDPSEKKHTILYKREQAQHRGPEFSRLTGSLLFDYEDTT